MDNNVDITNELELLKHLPEDVQAAVTSAEVGEQLENIGKVHKLHIDVLDDLFVETVDVMMGRTHPDKFVDRLEQSLSLSREEAALLATDINEQIFKKIQDSLKKMYQPQETMERGGMTAQDVTQVPLAVEEAPLKDDILKEIENPSATAPTVLTPPKPQIPLTTPPVVPPAPIVEEVAHSTPPSILGSKLSGMVGSTSSAIPPIQVPKKYIVDPYREPVDRGK